MGNYVVSAVAKVTKDGQETDKQVSGTGPTIAEAVNAALEQLGGIRLPEVEDPYPEGALTGLSLSVSFEQAPPPPVNGPAAGLAMARTRPGR